ncbi:WXG100 family type VII secretion target [Actinomadura roseirufa]|uniref:WXG100 family type VII secretion target n=1 Tax=Actinomadura roseirufa TaxID=2094049 RepID=UPI0010410E30|nr:hypothetical protein [Actinomadura roseirufa]
MTDSKNSPLRAGAPAGSPGSYGSKEQITALLRGTDPGTVAASGQGYLALASAYDSAMAQLRTFAHDLAQAWKGPASNAAQAQLRDLFGAAFEISSRSSMVGNAVTTHGTNYLAWYRQNMPTPKTIEEARQWMQGANARAAETWNAFPPDISTSLPVVHASRQERGAPMTGPNSGGDSGSPGSAGGGGSAGSGSPSGHGAGGGHSSGTPDMSGSVRPGGPAPAATGGSGSVIGHEVNAPHGGGVGGSSAARGQGGTHLAGFDPASLTGGGRPSGGSAGAAGGGGVGTGGSSFSGGNAGGDIPGGGSGLGRGFVSAPGTPGDPLGQGVASRGGAASAAGRPGAPGSGFPGTPGHGGGRDGRERDRGAWLPDEPDVWAGDIEAVPGVIGDAPPKPLQPEKDGRLTGDDEAALLRRLLARLEHLESHNDERPPPAIPPRMEWTD